MTPFKSLSAAAVLLAAGLSGCSSSSSSGHAMAGIDATSTLAGTATPASPSPASPGVGTPAAGPRNDADVTFAAMMIPHHQQAIEMSDTLLAKTGIAAPVLELATRIKAAQTPEITLMNGWLTGWGANPAATGMDGMTGMGAMGSGDGMMSNADMDAFMNADGASAQKMFLTGMIAHHQGAVAMAQRQLSQGQNPDAKALAQTIIDAQNAEITQMQQLLGT